MKLWHKVAIGLIAGILFGIFVGEYSVVIGGHVINIKPLYIIKPVGDLFVNAIQMIVIPLIFFSLVSGVTSISDPASLGRIGIKSCLTYLATTTLAIIIGLILALLLKPGVGAVIDLTSFSTETVDRSMVEFSLSKMLTNIVPKNAIGAMAQGNMLQVVFFSIFTGIALLKMGGQGVKLIGYFQLFAKLMFKMISLIILFSPYGAFALTAWIVGTQGTEVLYALGKLIGVVLLGMLIQYIIFGVLIYIFGKVSPIPFYRKSFEYQALAFSTSSSKATLATTMKVCKERLGVSDPSTSFILPLGASTNMDGMAIYLGICSIFFAQVAGVDLHYHDYAIIMLTATLGSIGGAGVPGSSLVMLPMILSAVHIPIEGVALIAGIDRILDMVRTTINITGDATVTLIVDSTEGNLNEKIYYSDN